MEKSIYSREHQLLCGLLRSVRLETGLRQADVAESLGVNQTFVSKYEKGERRLDVIELRAVCRALGIDLPTMVASLEASIAAAHES